MSADLDLDAAEYVLGTLDPQERQDFAARLTSDAAARTAVTAWEGRLADLALAVPTVVPPSHVWTEIERALARTATTASPFKLIQGGGLSTSSSSMTLQRSVRRWRATAILSSGLAAALVVFVGLREMSDRTGDGVSYVAAVNRGGDKPALLVRVDLKTRRVSVRPVAAEAPAGKSLELWYISDGKAPRSMGVVDKLPVSLTIPQGSTAEAATFAVSVEPPGGSTTGGPTGPVVYSGQLIKE